MITWACTTCGERKDFEKTEAAMRWVAKHARQSHLCVRVMARGEVAPPGLGMYAVDNIEIEAQEVEGRDQG